MLASTSPPRFLVLRADPSRATNAMWAVQRSRRARVVFLRGTKMTTIEALFDEFAATLQFPYYFGENWAALDECLADLSWFEGDAYALVVLDADRVLPDDSDFQALVQLLDSVAAEWTVATEFRATKPFHVVLQVTSDRAASLTARLDRAGVQYVADFDPVASGDTR